MVKLLKPSAKIEIVWELGFYMNDGTYIPAREALFDICIDIEKEQGLVTDDLSDDVLYDILVDKLNLPKSVILNDLESGHESINDSIYVYNNYLANVSRGFSPKFYKEVDCYAE